MKKFLCYFVGMYSVSLFAGAPDSTIVYNSSGVPLEKEVVVANDNQKLITTYSWNATLGSWEKQSKNTMDYSDKETLVSDTLDLWFNNDWTRKELSVDSFDVAGNLVSTYYYDWLKNKNDWDLIKKEAYVYENGILVGMETSSWNKGDFKWKREYNSVYEYDAAGNLIMVTDSNVAGLNYLPEVRTSYTYNENGLESSVEELWDPILLDWVNNTKLEYAYDEYGQQYIATKYTWVTTPTEMWEIAFTSEVFHDSDGDGITNRDDTDDDNDGVDDAVDNCAGSGSPRSLDEVSVLAFTPIAVQDQFIGGTTYTFGTQSLTDAGTYYEYFVSHDGCDSVVALELARVPEFEVTKAVQLCAGDSLSFGGAMVKSAGSLSKMFVSSKGTDSLVTLTVAVQNVDVGISTGADHLLLSTAVGNVQWLECGSNVLVNDQGGFKLTNSFEGEFAAIITVNGCTDTTDCMLMPTNILAIDISSSPGDYVVYPNPVQGTLYFNQAVLDKVLSVDVYNINGVRLLSLDKQAVGQGSINFENFNAGYYFVELKTANESYLKRVIVQ